MRLDAYLERVGFTGTPQVNVSTLTALHRGHLLNIPYENLDVQLGRRVGFEAEAIFDKLVTQRRGGWCYEMNGLLAWALETIGFKLTRMAGGVGRATAGDAVLGNHLMLRVDLQQPYLADVGFGDGLLEPVPITAGRISQRGCDFALEHLCSDWWRFHNTPHGGAPSFDFQLRAADPTLLGARCHALQTDPESVFVQNALCFRQAADSVALLRGKVLTRTRGQRSEQTVLSSAAAYVATLRDVFGIDLPESAALWQKIEARHAQLLGA